MSTGIPDLYPRHKVPEEIRECMGCHLKVIARGDQDGWKGVDGGGGLLHWYCNKPACQQVRDEFIQRRQAELIQEQEIVRRVAQNPAVKPVDDLSDAEVDAEEQRLKSRLMALKARKKADEGQSIAAPDTYEVPEATEIAAKTAAEIEDSGLFDGVIVHQTQNGIESLCGEEGAMFAPGEDLPMNCIPCVKCAEVMDGQSESQGAVALDPDPLEVAYGLAGPRQEEVCYTGDQAPVIGQGGDVSETAEAVRDDPPQPVPRWVVDFDKLPKFSPKVIQDVVNGKYDGGQILVPPSAYPDLNLETVDLDWLRGGIDKMFQGGLWAVDKLLRARKGEEFVGLVFTLKAVPAVPATEKE